MKTSTKRLKVKQNSYTAMLKKLMFECQQTHIEINILSVIPF